MESEVGSSRILLYPKSLPEGGFAYLKSLPGIIRLFNVLFGVISLILVLLGFSDDYPDSSDYSYYHNDHHERQQQYQQIYIPDRYERRRKPWLRLTSDGSYATFESYYGAGYDMERPNVAQLVCIVICLAFSVFYLFFLVICPGCHDGTRNRGWNRFLNLSIAIIQMSGFLNGIMGLLVFRSYCCHVDFTGTERHKSELEGYFREPCLCYIAPKYRQGADDTEYKTLYFHDAPGDVVFHTAQPHHFIPHVICLCFMGLNMILHFTASIWI